MKNSYFANPVVSLYEGEDDAVAIVPPATAPATPPIGTGLAGNDPNAQVNVDPNARFTQDQVNKIVGDRLAKDRKKNEERYVDLEKSYQDLIANKALSDDEKVDVEAKLEELQKQHRTKEEQAKHEKNQLKDKYEGELQHYKDAAVRWENQHKEFLIEKSLLEAAVTKEAYMPDQVLAIVQKWTKLVEEVDENDKPTGRLTPMVDLPDIDADTGKNIITYHTPMDAVERLKEVQPNLFKSNIVSGVGGNSNTGGMTPGADGQIDLKDLTTEQFMKLRKEDPAKLGLRSHKRR